MERGFAFLPSRCELVLDAVARQQVLDNVRRQLRLNRRELADKLRSLGDVGLAQWMAASGYELNDVLRCGSWTRIRRDAGLPTAPAGPDEDALLRRVAALAHVDDVERADAYRRLLTRLQPHDELSARE